MGIKLNKARVLGRCDIFPMINGQKEPCQLLDMWASFVSASSSEFSNSGFGLIEDIICPDKPCLSCTFSLLICGTTRT